MEKYQRVALTKDRLREALDSTGKKQIDLVRETGLNRGTISRYLSGEVEPRQEAAVKLARALDVSEMWLWGYDTKPDRSPEQKKNDDLVKVIAKLRKEPDFFDVVSLMATLPAEQYAIVKGMISALAQK